MYIHYDMIVEVETNYGHTASVEVMQRKEYRSIPIQRSVCYHEEGRPISNTHVQSPDASAISIIQIEGASESSGTSVDAELTRRRISLGFASAAGDKFFPAHFAIPSSSHDHYHIPRSLTNSSNATSLSLHPPSLTTSICKASVSRTCLSSRNVVSFGHN